MPDTMSFPKTLDEFMEQYKIVDTEQVYTNGTELVPIFRIKQWEDAHKPKKGKWIRSGEGSYELYECSLCGQPWLHWWADAMDPDRMSKVVKCCPNCGADMREEKTDAEIH